MWPTARNRPDNDGMTGSLVAARAAKAARAAIALGPPADTVGARIPGPAAASPDTNAAPLLAVSGLSLSYGRVRALDEDQPDRAQRRAGRAGWRERRGQDHPGPLHRRRRSPGLAARSTWPDRRGSRQIRRRGGQAEGSRWSGRTWPCATTWMWPPTSCSAGNGPGLLYLRQPLPRGRRVRAGRAAHSASRTPPVASAICPAGSASWWAVARAMGRRPRLLALDEPTASLGVKEAAQVEELIMGLREQGTTILLACHRDDIDQMFRLADRVVVLRQGRIVSDLIPGRHPPGRRGGAAFRTADRHLRAPPAHPAARADRPAGLDGSPVVEFPVADLVRARLERCPANGCAFTWSRTGPCSARRRFGFAPGELDPWTRLPFGPGGGPVGLAAADERPVIADNVPRRRGLAELPRPGQDGEGGQLVVGSGARAERAERGHYRFVHAPRGRRTAARRA